MQVRIHRAALLPPQAEDACLGSPVGARSSSEEHHLCTRSRMTGLVGEGQAVAGWQHRWPGFTGIFYQGSGQGANVSPASAARATIRRHGVACCATLRSPLRCATGDAPQPPRCATGTLRSITAWAPVPGRPGCPAVTICGPRQSTQESVALRQAAGVVLAGECRPGRLRSL